jgi:NADH-quinone oxidoreductase subunit F
MASIEGQRGMPRARPPFPAQAGIDAKPTNINNVETWANVPLIIKNGADWYGEVGTEDSKGTKIFLPKFSPWPARSTTPDWWKCPSDPRSKM